MVARLHVDGADGDDDAVCRAGGVRWMLRRRLPPHRTGAEIGGERCCL